MEDWLELQDPGMQIAEGHAGYRRGETTSLGAFPAEARQAKPNKQGTK